MDSMIGSFFFKVKVNCMTYNHSAFITDTMNGFVIQQTNFPFVCCIIDDASSDGEQDVIRHFVSENFDLKDVSIAYEKDTYYGHVTFAQHKTNRNCYFAVVYLKENHYSQKKSKAPYLTEWEDTKYIALCEGDDYWTEPLKLQKQVNFLEEHEEYIVCSHDFVKFYQNTMTFEESSYFHDCFHMGSSFFLSYTLDEYFVKWWTQPLTCLYRNGDYLNSIPNTKYKHYRDDIFFYYILKEGKGALLKDVMGVYRVHEGGVWQGKQVLKQHEAGRDNALAIYFNENEERAFRKATRDEISVMTILWSEQHRWKAFKEIVSYRKMVPVSEYRRFLKNVYEWLSGKMKRKMKAFFKRNA